MSFNEQLIWRVSLRTRIEVLRRISRRSNCASQIVAITQYLQVSRTTELRLHAIQVRF